MDRRFLPLTALLALLAPPLALGGWAAAARAEDPPRPKKRPKDFDFGQPEKPAAAPGTPGAAPTRPTAPDADAEAAAIRREIGLLGTWPARDGVRAAESLLLRGPSATPYLTEALAGGDRTVQPGAAWVLGKVGEETHVVPILQAAARLNGYRAEVFFDAAAALSPERTKEWLFGFLSLDRAQLREESTRWLLRSLQPVDAPRVAQLTESDKVGARAAGLRLLDAVKAADAEDRLARALSDVAPVVARTAASLLALRSREGDLGRLNALAREGEARERAYAVLALADVARARQVNPFEPTTLIDIMGRRGLLHPDKLNRVTAAIGLVYGALDSSDETTVKLLDGTVVDVLVDALVGEHFRDFEVLADPVFGALRRVSGQDLPGNAVAWGTWWQAERSRFQARRSLQAVVDADLPFSMVRYEGVGPDGRRRSAVFAPLGAQRPGAYLVPREVFLSLVAALKDVGIFDAGSRARRQVGEHASVTLAVRNLESRVGLSPADSPDTYGHLKARFESLEEANLWQRYRDTDRWPDLRAWHEAVSAEMAEAADASVRAALLRSQMLAAFDDLPSDVARAEALDRLMVGGEPLTQSQARMLLQGVLSLPALGDVELRALRLALTDGTEEATRREALDGLAQRGEPAALELLAALLAQGGVERVREAFTDARPSVRAAACRAAVTLVERTDPATDAAGAARLVERLKPGLDILRKDEPAVAVRALVALARLGDASVMPQMETLYREGDAGQKQRVVAALGEIPGDGAHGLLTLVLSEQGPGATGLRAEALGALARTNHPNAVRYLGFYLLSDPAPEVQRAAGDALVGLGTPDARFSLIEALTRGEKDAVRRARLIDVLGRFDGRLVEEVLQRQLDDTAPEVVAVAALRGGAKGIAAAVPHLIALLRRGGDAERDQALAVLEDLTCRRVAVPGYGEKADAYEAWWTLAKVGTDRTWFREALESRGYDVSSLVTYVKGEPGLAPVPLLLKALRDDDPVVRSGAARALERLSGRSLGPVGRGVPELEAAATADLWTDWWETEGRAAASSSAPAPAR